jgi:glucosylceramidase
MKVSLLITIMAIQLNCSFSSQAQNTSPLPTVITNEVDFWLTKGDQSIKLQ